MARTIAIAGKGGTGKTTVAALLVSRLVATGRTPVLAVDADPNSCLDAALGVEVRQTVGRVREAARDLAGQGIGSGVSKQQMLELKIAESLVEADAFDLIAMGRCEGPGCYCYANNVLKRVIEQLADEYPVVVVDNEAGLENLSRRIVRKVDLLVMVTDPSRAGLTTVARLYELAREMGLDYGSLAIVVNRLREAQPPEEAAVLKKLTGADELLALPTDPALAEIAERGGSLIGFDADPTIIEPIDRLIARAGLQ
jgi:CO dehydrogenase maturation factor